MRDGAGDVFPVAWVPAPNGKPLDFPTAFVSSKYRPDDLDGHVDVGELRPDSLVWSPFKSLPKRICDTCYVGDKEWFLGDWPSDAPPVVLASDGFATDCDGGCMGCVKWVGLVGDPIFVVSGSPVNAMGNISLDLADQAGNLVLASPNGSTGKPTFRALVAADIPPIPPPTPPGPGTLTNLRLWFDANQGTYQDTALTIPASANNDPVRGWKDLSPSLNNATDPTGFTLKTSYQNGNAALLSVAALFNQLILGTEFATTADCAIFVAVEPPSIYRGILLASNLGSPFSFDFDTVDFAYPVWVAYDGVSEPVSDTAAFAPGVFGIWSFVRTAGICKLYWNGQQFTTTPDTFSGYVRVGRISGTSAPSLWFDGHIGEIFACETTVDDATRQRMENYLSQKWIPQPLPYVKQIFAGPGIAITGPGTAPTIAVNPASLPGIDGSKITSGTVNRSYLDATFEADLAYAIGVLPAGQLGSGYLFSDLVGVPGFATNTLTPFSGSTSAGWTDALVLFDAMGLHGVVSLKNTGTQMLNLRWVTTDCFGNTNTPFAVGLASGDYVTTMLEDNGPFSNLQAYSCPIIAATLQVQIPGGSTTTTYSGYASQVG